MTRKKPRFRVGQTVEFIAGHLHPVAERGTIVGSDDVLGGSVWVVSFTKRIHVDSLRPLTAREIGPRRKAKR